jgi:hypothetical protein
MWRRRTVNKNKISGLRFLFLLLTVLITLVFSIKTSPYVVDGPYLVITFLTNNDVGNIIIVIIKPIVATWLSEITSLIALSSVEPFLVAAKIKKPTV